MASSSLFPAPPLIQFPSKEDGCDRCGRRLKVRKTNTRKVNTLHIGPFYATETVGICPACQCTYPSDQLAKLVAPGANFGYDILVYVGEALFLRHRRSREITVELQARNIRISPSEVDLLARKFIVYLAIAHRQCSGRIKQVMRRQGGYIFHLDGTCEGKGPFLVSGLDSLTEIVLGNVKLPSEKADKIVPFLEEIKQVFGHPMALVHDMGSGILKAVAKVFPHTPDFICHYHFLRDIGKDLFEEEYDLIRKRLRKHGLTTPLHYRAKKLKEIIDEDPALIDVFYKGVQNKNFSDSSLEWMPAVSAYSLIQWALDGKNQGQGYGFPFDRPHVVFAQRLYAIYSQLDAFTNIHLRSRWRDNKPLFKLSRDLMAVVSDKILQRTMTEIESKIAIFDELRDAMRIAPKAGSEGLNSDDIKTPIHTIEKSVQDFRKRLAHSPEYPTRKDHQKMIAQIDKYWKKLFADPIIVDTPDGTVSIQPQRTNNIMERFFRDFRRRSRRKTGNNSMNKTLQTMLADTPLVRNLENPQYMDLLLEGKATLEERFAEIDADMVRKHLREARNNPEKIPAKIKRIIAAPQLPEIIANLFHNKAKTPESNRIL
ncbi:MAG: transposase [Mariprofundaceae bacterium]